MYVDLVGQTEFFDIKNVFGTLTKTKKGFSYSKESVLKFHTTQIVCKLPCISKELPKLKPCLTYASDSDRVVFTPSNCVELRPESLQYYYEELVLYPKVLETKIKIS